MLGGEGVGPRRGRVGGEVGIKEVVRGGEAVRVNGRERVGGEVLRIGEREVMRVEEVVSVQELNRDEVRGRKEVVLEVLVIVEELVFYCLIRGRERMKGTRIILYGANQRESVRTNSLMVRTTYTNGVDAGGQSSAPKGDNTRVNPSPYPYFDAYFNLDYNPNSNTNPNTNPNPGPNPNCNPNPKGNNTRGQILANTSDNMPNDKGNDTSTGDSKNNRESQQKYPKH
jgi:hypothetical protein